jgi:RNA polymerase sigma-70 factor, ECF subfamily
MIEESIIGLPNVSRSRGGLTTTTSAEKASACRQYVPRIAAGDESALAALYDESNQLVYSTALRILRDPADAEEATLDVYLQVWRTAQNYNERRGSVGAWLVMLARSRAIDRLRSRRSREELEGPQKDYVEVRSTGQGPEQEAQVHQQRRRVLSALDALPPEQREAVELAFFSGFTHSELAVRLSQPLGTVKTRIRNGMMKLRELLGESA